MPGEKMEELRILHCFADYGAECEILSDYGEVLRIGVDPKDNDVSVAISADAHINDEEKGWSFPLQDDVHFDLGVFHPVCSKWSSTTSISGDPDNHVNMIPSARKIAREYCEYHIIENVPRAPLNNPIILNGRMFGLPIEYERAFETNFNVPQPPRYKQFWAQDGPEENAETSSFFFTEKSRRWWGSVKGVPARSYPKQHLAKNVIPGAYIHHLCRAWLEAFEDDTGIDYTNYDKEMETKRRMADNRNLTEFTSGEGSESSSDENCSG
jgi:hypothetical protein